MAQLLDTTLPPTSASAHQARLLVDAELHDYGLDHVRDPAALVVAELVRNVIRHTHSDIRNEIELDSTWLHVRVSDRSPYLPDQREQPNLHEGGWGLHIVADVADDWGAHTTFDGKTIWACRPSWSGTNSTPGVPGEAGSTRRIRPGRDVRTTSTQTGPSLPSRQSGCVHLGITSG